MIEVSLHLNRDILVEMLKSHHVRGKDFIAVYKIEGAINRRPNGEVVLVRMVIAAISTTSP
jgi:hypothetical protein